jgi:hypothetical protein
MMKERPILFSAPMVRAILDGTKTQTRRIIKDLGGDNDWGCPCPFFINGITSTAFFDAGEDVRLCPYGYPGELLWVRETFCPAHYKAGANQADLDWLRERGMRWKPSIHMPRSASRITLEIVSVRVERLNDISEDDAKAEGVTILGGCKTYKQEFELLWNQIHGNWNSNPWVWVIEFRDLWRD